MTQPEQEPVAIVNEGMGGIEWFIKCLPDDTPLYAAPPSIEAAVLAEREACAKVCDEIENDAYATYRKNYDSYAEGFSAGALACLEAIRARSKK